MNKLRIINNLEIVKEIDNVAISGKLKCSCNCSEFYIYHTGKQTKGIFSPDIINKNGQLVIKTKCTQCNEELIILDSTIDGIKPKIKEKSEFNNFVIKNNIDKFKITIYYNYNEENFKTNKFENCFIDIENKNLKNEKRIVEY